MLVEHGPPAAMAVPRGEFQWFPGGLIISNFALPGGRRGYCVEVHLGEPSGDLIPFGTVEWLPGREGMFHAYRDPRGVRQMNYLIEAHGQTTDPWAAATVQLTIWRIRERFQAGNVELDRKLAILARSEEGRRLIAESDGLAQLAAREATPPSAPTAVTGKLDWRSSEDGYRLEYPRGTTSLGVEGGTFVESGSRSLAVPGDAAGSALVRVDSGSRALTATGRWASEGHAGWRSELVLHDTRTARGEVGQRLVLATGRQDPAPLTGDFARIRESIPLPSADPTYRSVAQDTGQVGGLMEDALIIEARPGTVSRHSAEAVAEFTAYLLPEPGTPKLGPGWTPRRRVGPGSTDEPGGSQPGSAPGPGSTPGLGSAPGSQSTRGPGSAPEPPPGLGADRGPGSASNNVLELWTAEELAAMSERERCLAQPVARVSNIPVPTPGMYFSGALPVEAAGTIHWVERVTAGGEVLHEGECGIANETTSIARPTLSTKADPEARVGETIRDTATIGGEFFAGAEYLVGFEAFRSDPGDEPGARPQCTPDRRILASPRTRVSRPGEVTSPELRVRWEHGAEVHWVATLFINAPGGVREIARGECGEAGETTRIDRPSVETLADRHAIVGGAMQDRAEVRGGILDTASTRWELRFLGYRSGDDPAAGCDADLLLFETPPQRIRGAEDVVSPPVEVEPGWEGDVRWIAELWLIEDGERILAHRGACGLPAETTRITAPTLRTEAVSAVPVGGAMTDLAIVEGALPEREGFRPEIVFRGYRSVPAAEGAGASGGTPRCEPEDLLFETGPVPLDRTGRARSPEVTALPEHGEAVHWIATLRLAGPDRSIEVAGGACGEPGETTLIQSQRLSTRASGNPVAGEPLFDTATVEGTIPHRPGIELRVVFDAYRAAEDGTLRCAPEDRLPELSDPEGAEVTAPGEVTSRSVSTGPDHVGDGGFVAALLLREDGEEHVIARGTCGEASEAFTVRPPRIELPYTGAPAAGPLGLALAAAGLVLSGSALLIGRRRGRTP